MTEHWSILVAVACVTIALLRQRPILLAVVAMLLLLALTVRWPRFSLFEIVVGATGALSISSIFASGALLAASFGVQPPSPQQLTGIARGLFLLGSLLYISAFGFTSFSLYRYGFDPLNLLLIAAPALAWSAWRGWLWMPAWLSVVFVAYWLRVLPSANWWDYLIDPLLWAVASLFLLFTALVRRNGQSGQTSDAAITP